jgi:hypothetical protein
LILSDFIPRNELLEKMANMDFLVNFDNNTPVHIPSKLIDYAICGRPVLNIKKTLDPMVIQQFMKADYQNRMEIGSIDQYKIENVCAAFLNIVK